MKFKKIFYFKDFGMFYEIVKEDNVRILLFYQLNQIKNKNEKTHYQLKKSTQSQTG